MNILREQRRLAIADLIRSNSLSSQEELGARLAALGFSVTQATVSRDLDHLGAVKVRRGGEMIYALEEDAGAPPDPSQVSTILRDWARSIDRAANLIVIKTPPGSAHLVGVALDRSQIPEVVGTICGDDTLFVACRSPDEAADLALHLRTLRSGPAH